MSAYNVAAIQTLPVPQVERCSDGTCAMIWHIQFTSTLIANEFDTVVKETQHPKIRFSSQVEGASAAVKVGFSEGDYTTAYDETFQLLRHLEAHFGEVETLEGCPRTKWGMQFVISRHVRPAERDQV